MRRILPHLMLLTIVVAATIAGGARTTSTARPAATALPGNYSLIINRNIFLRNRSSRPPRPDYNRPPADGSSELILAGVAVQGPERIAFFENSGTGETARLTVGQDFGGGTITAVRLDGVDLTVGKTVRTIAVGETLSGRRIEPAAPTAASSPTASPAPSGPNADDNGDDDEPANVASQPGTAPPAAKAGPISIEERMRQQRLQESK